jgi:hypothetical protein
MADNTIIEQTVSQPLLKPDNSLHPVRNRLFVSHRGIYFLKPFKVERRYENVSVTETVTLDGHEFNVNKTLKKYFYTNKINNGETLVREYKDSITRIDPKMPTRLENFEFIEWEKWAEGLETIPYPIGVRESERLADYYNRNVDQTPTVHVARLGLFNSPDHVEVLKGDRVQSLLNKYHSLNGNARTELKALYKRFHSLIEQY